MVVQCGMLRMETDIYWSSPGHAGAIIAGGRGTAEHKVRGTYLSMVTTSDHITYSEAVFKSLLISRIKWEFKRARANATQHNFSSTWCINRTLVSALSSMKLKISCNGLNPFPPDSAKSKIDKFPKITNWIKLTNTQHHSEVLLNSFSMNGRTSIFCP